MEELNRKNLPFVEMMAIEKKKNYTYACIFSLIQKKCLCESCIWKVSINVSYLYVGWKKDWGGWVISEVEQTNKKMHKSFKEAASESLAC